MSFKLITAAVLTSAVALGCGERRDENAQTFEQNQAAPGTEAEVAPVEPAPSPGVDTPANNAGATTGSAPAARRAPRPAPALEPAPRQQVRDTSPAPRTDVQRRVERDTAGNAGARVVREVTIPAGTSLPLELTSALSTETAQVEHAVTARLRRDVEVNGVTALPAGSIFHGEVIDVDRPGRVRGRARLGVRFHTVAYGGNRIALRTNPLSWEGEETKGEDATKIGAGAGIGAIVGGIIGGGDGAAKGAAIGGAAGTGAVLATRGRDVELAPGAGLNATTASAVEVPVR